MLILILNLFARSVDIVLNCTFEWFILLVKLIFHIDCNRTPPATDFAKLNSMRIFIGFITLVVAHRVYCNDKNMNATLQ